MQCELQIFLQIVCVWTLLIKIPFDLCSQIHGYFLSGLLNLHHRTAFYHTCQVNNCFTFLQEVLCFSLLLFKSLINLEFILYKGHGSLFFSRYFTSYSELFIRVIGSRSSF